MMSLKWQIPSEENTSQVSCSDACTSTGVHVVCDYMYMYLDGVSVRNNEVTHTVCHFGEAKAYSKDKVEDLGYHVKNWSKPAPVEL